MPHIDVVERHEGRQDGKAKSSAKWADTCVASHVGLGQVVCVAVGAGCFLAQNSVRHCMLRD